ncbi:protein tyrosine phosphatase [Mucilaginibacter sp. PAMC 26640]|nr:protein tyrosine phosphatase [Mucilaginibacter sp. PAMC 26640]
MPNLLFICSKNQWRSPTAELLFKNHSLHRARSAGTSDKARVRLNQKMIDWADEIFVMENRHREMVKQNFRLNGRVLTVLDIDDLYQFNDPELVEILRISLAEYL